MKEGITFQHRHFMMRLLIVGAFVFCGAAVYALAHWLAWNDPVYQRVFWSPFRRVALLAGMVERLGICWPLAVGFLLGLSVVAVHARRWLLLPVSLLLLGVGVFILVGLL